MNPPRAPGLLVSKTVGKVLAKILAKVLAGLALAGAMASAGPARADLLLTCDSTQLGALITCAQADVGKPCEGGGQCYAVPCAVIGSPNGVVYKCDACPTVLPVPDGGCAQSSTLGTACGDGGTCSGINTYCGATTKFVCSIPAASRPTGPPAGEADGGGAGTSGSAGTSGTGAAGTSGTGAAGTSGTGTAGTSGTGTAGTSGGGGSSTPPGSSSGGGCEVAPGAPVTLGFIAVVLAALGLVFMLIARRRRAR